MVHRLPLLPPLADTVGLYTKVGVVVRKSQRDYLHGTAGRVKSEAASRVTTAILEGEPAPALAGYARETGADLVVMTTHGRGGLERAWLGSVADELIRTLGIPMLVIRPGEGEAPAPRLERILVPLDGSRHAEAVLPVALAMASLFDASLALRRVVLPVALMTGPPASFPAGIDTELTAIEQRRAQAYLDRLGEQLRGVGARVSGAAVLGRAVCETILAIAHERGPGMVALATRGRGGLRRLLLGSVADKLLRRGDLPMLVTRPRPG
jgi:nucleotide-binding universal stress UspA family protein